MDVREDGLWQKYTASHPASMSRVGKIEKGSGEQGQIQTAQG